MKLFLSCASGSRLQATASRNAPSRFRALAQKFSAARIHGGDTRLHGIQVQICATVRNLAHQRQFVKHCRQKNQKKGAERAAFIRSSAPGRLRLFATLPAASAASAAKCEEPGRKSVLAPSCRIRHASSPRPPQKALDDRAAGTAAQNANPEDAALRAPVREALPGFSRSRAAMRRIAVRSYLS